MPTTPAIEAARAEAALAKYRASLPRETRCALAAVKNNSIFAPVAVEVERLVAQNAELAHALAFYADRANWKEQEIGIGMAPSDVEDDYGTTARSALKRANAVTVQNPAGPVAAVAETPEPTRYRVLQTFETLGASGTELYDNADAANQRAVIMREQIALMVAGWTTPEEKPSSPTGSCYEIAAWDHAQALAGVTFDAAGDRTATSPAVYGMDAGFYIAKQAVKIEEVEYTENETAKPRRSCRL